MIFFIILCITTFIALAYSYIVLKVSSDWKKIPVFELPEQNVSTSVSIIIAARNEEKNIVNCLNTIIQQDYPTHLFEIIVVDDHSVDSTALLAQVISAKNKNNTIKVFKAFDFNALKGGKKNALNIGIEHSAAQLIITTDADCIMGHQWLSGIVAFYEQYQPKMIIGPVSIYGETTGLEFLQSMELMSLIAFTGVYCYRNKPIMSNGANLAYERNAFIEVGGFAGIDEIASGDDVLLMNKFDQKFPGGIKFLKSKEAIVYTKAQYSFRQFIDQRIRWISKGKTKMARVSIVVAIITGAMNMGLFINLVLSFFYGKFALLFLILFALKLITDLILLRTVSVFFNKRIKAAHIFVSQIVYSFCVGLILLLGIRKRYNWKGRTVS